MSLFGREDQVREVLPFDGSAVLHPAVLGEDDAGGVFSLLMQEVAWESRTITVFGKRHLEPRLSAWYGDDGARYSYSGIDLEPSAWTPTLARLRALCEQVSGARYNSVLCNLYRDGNDKMGWHSDDEPVLGSEPTIASLSLGATRRFRLRHRGTREVVECGLETGSLLVMSGLSQKCWMHEVPRQKKIVEPRINLTFRHIHF